MADKVALVRLRAVNDAFDRAMDKSRQKVKQLADSGTDLETLGKKFDQVGDKLTKRVTLPLAALGAGAVFAAVSWESAWAGVLKTVDGTAEQLDALEQALRDMAKEKPASHSEIAAVAEAAGQLGVAVDDVAEFTSVMIDLGETTNLSADEAATALARFSNIMGTSTSDVDRLGSTIVDLGNNSATTEREIVELATRLAAAGKIAGLSESDVLAFAASLTSVGVEAEAGGTAMSKVFMSIRDAVIDGGDKLQTFSRVAGVSATEFANAFRRDPAEAITMFVEGMGRLSASGQSTTAVFEELELTDQRLMRAILSTGEAQGLLANQLSLGRGAWEQNTALTEEAAKRYETVASQLRMLRNHLVDLGIQLGEKALPVLNALIDFGVQAVELFSRLPGPVQAVVVGFLALTASIGPALKVGGFFLQNLKDIQRIGSKAFDKIALGAYSAAGNIQLLSGAAAIAGLAIAGIAMKWAEAAAEAAAAEARVQGYTDAIRESGDVVEGVTKRLRQMAEAGDLSNDVLEAMAAAGVSMDELGVAATEGGAAMDDLRRRMLAAFAAENIDPAARREIELLGYSVEDVATEIARGGDAFAMFGASTPTVHLQRFLKEMIDFDDVLVTTNSDVSEAAKRSGLLSKVLGDAEDEAIGAASAVGQFGDQSLQTAQDVTQLTKAVNAVFDSMFGSAVQAAELDRLFGDFNSTFERTASSGGRAARSIDLVAEKQKALEKATQDAENANEQWQRSVEDVERANRDLIKAQEELERLLKGPSARDRAEALNRQRREELALEDARQRLADAQEALAEAEELSDPEELAAARRNLARAELDLETQTWRLEDATKAYNEVANWSADTDEKVKNARDKVTQAERRLEAATADSAKRMRELQAAEQAAADVAARSPASFAQAEGGVARVRDRAFEARNAFLDLARGIEQAITKIIGMDITAAQKAGEIDKIIGRIMANPFLSEDQRNQLLLFAWASKANVIDASMIRHPLEMYDAGGVVSGRRGEPRLVLAHGGETILPTHKRPLESITAAPVLAGVGAASTDARRGDFIIQQATFGTEGVVQDLDWWWRTQGAGV